MHTRRAERADCQRLGEVIVSATRSAFEGRVPEDCLLELPLATSVANWRRSFDRHAFDGSTQVLLVAEDEASGVIGFVLAGGHTADVLRDATIAAAYPREIMSLNVAPDWQQRGVGRLLVEAAADWLLAQQERTMAVQVLEQNPNRGFYVRLGARELGSQPYDWAGFATRQVIYGWDDLSLVRRIA